MLPRIRAAFRRLAARVCALPPAQLVVLGYASYMLIGWILLCVPVFQEDSPAGGLDHLFTAVSAVSTTGLVTVGTSASYSWLGEFVVLTLFQLGGLGYMTVSSFTVLAWTGQLSDLRQRIAGSSLQLPPGFDLGQFLRLIVTFTLLMETLGTLCLYPIFIQSGAPMPAWQAVFHSVSAFCTAGFGLFPDSLEAYRDDPRVNLIVAVLSTSGAIGFIVITDIWRTLRSRAVHLTYTSRVILWSTVWLIGGGSLFLAAAEPAFAGLPWSSRLWSSLFQAMTASTTVGFNTAPIGDLAPASIGCLMLLMVIGASPVGTGGGLKTTTVSALWGVMVSVVRQRSSTTFLGRTIPALRIRTAIASLMFYLLVLGLGVLLLALTETAPWLDLQFEAVSALGTVGLSRGVTGDLTTAGKWTVIGLMFLGRVGPLALALAFFRRRDDPEPACAEEDVVL